MTSEPDSPAGDSATIRKRLAERARYEREVAALDLSDAEQAEFRSGLTEISLQSCTTAPIVTDNAP